VTRRFAVSCVILAFLLGACGGDDPDSARARQSPSPTPVPTPCAIRDGSTEAQRSDSMPETAPLTDVRHSKDGCPRIVFEFSSHEPDYVVEYAEGPFSECGSGEPVSTDSWNASAFLTVRLEPSSTADLSKEDVPQTYEGPRDIEVDGDVLKHLKVICDFEAVLEWVVGLDARHDFTAFTLDDPARIVIDISET
jgi:hypothetical protein